MLRFEYRNWPALCLLLDAKYRIDASAEYVSRYGFPGPPEDAINVLHRYRDAILAATSRTDKVPKRIVVEAVAAFPYSDIPGYFRQSRWWQALQNVGIGAVPLLPGNEELLRDWLRSALTHGGWFLADKVIHHRAHEKTNEWKVAASQIALIGTLRGDAPGEHLECVIENRCYFVPLTKQPRQLSAKWIAIYSPTALRSPGAVTHLAPVENVEVLSSPEINTPWQSARDAEAMMVI